MITMEERLSCSLTLSKIPDCCDPVKVEFSNVAFCVTTGCYKKEKKTILSGVSGRFLGGQLSAIMGPSGAGKTSLMNILAGYNVDGYSGSVTTQINGSTNRPHGKCSTYIMQNFEFLPHLTVKETMQVAAGLKLGNKAKEGEKRTLISHILDLLCLTPCSKTRVGNLSGGEKKRLSIGVELITNPRIMFLDEPTSGLDSSSSIQLMLHLKSLVRDGRAVICTIHQPSSKVFGLFDHLYVLSRGNCIYRGLPEEVLPFFRSVGLQCPRLYNPADFVIEVASGDYGEVNKLAAFVITDESSLATSIESPDCSPERDDVTERTKMLEGGTSYAMANEKGEQKRLSFQFVQQLDNRCKVSTWTQFRILYKRTLLCTLRDLHLGMLRISAHIVVGVLLGSLFYGIGNEAAEVFSNNGCVFFILMFLYFGNIMPTVLTFPTEMAVFRREFINNWYSVFAYFLAKSFADLPFQILCPTLFVVPVYFMTDQPHDLSRFVMVWVVCVLLVEVGQSMGLLCGVLFNLQIGIFMAPASAIPMLLFSGFFIHRRTMAANIRWITYTSHFGYSYQGMMEALYSFNRTDLTCSTAYCHYRTPNKLLKELDVDDGLFLDNLVALVVYALVVRLLILLALVLRTRQMRQFKRDWQ